VQGHNPTGGPTAGLGATGWLPPRAGSGRATPARRGRRARRHPQPGFAREKRPGGFASFVPGVSCCRERKKRRMSCGKGALQIISARFRAGPGEGGSLPAGLRTNWREWVTNRGRKPSRSRRRSGSRARSLAGFPPHLRQTRPSERRSSPGVAAVVNDVLLGGKTSFQGKAMLRAGPWMDRPVVPKDLENCGLQVPNRDHANPRHRSSYLVLKALVHLRQLHALASSTLALRDGWRTGELGDER